jgi:hypothetical protein
MGMVEERWSEASEHDFELPLATNDQRAPVLGVYYVRTRYRYGRF